MTSKISEIKKRDGSVAAFDSSKIANAIFKAARSVGGQDRNEADKLADKVVKELEKETEGIPTVEQLQDLVEKVLIEAGHAKTAKAYIVYRQKRAEAREEKMRVLEKDYLDDVDKRFDVNALRVLKARYLKKDDKGKLIETPKQLFTRISTHLGIPEIFYDEKVFDINEKQNVFEIEEFNKEEQDNKVSIGKYKLNQYHMEGVRRLYERYNKQKKMKVSWSQFLELLEQGYFNNYERNIDEFYSLMVEKRFMPNTPAIANFGNSLGMGSACFHPDQLILTEDGPRKISEVNAGDKVLTHRGRFRKVKQVFVRDSNSLLSFECKKLPKTTMLATEEHPILTHKDGEAGWYPAYMIKEGDKVALSYPAETKDVEKILVSEFVDGITVKDDKCCYEYSGGKFNAFVHTTKSVNNTILVDYDLMKLFGFYLAEGTVSEEDCVRFTLSADEADYCNEIISIMERKFGVSARIESTNDAERKWLSLRFHSTILAKFFISLFGTGYNKKKIPSWIMLLPAEKQKGLMSGMIRGDGTVFKNWNKMNAKLVMSNTSLVYAFWQMCMRCGVFAALGKESMPKLAKVQPVRCTLGDAKGQLLMNELFGETIQETVSEDKTFVVNGIVFTDVEKIEKIDYKGAVYNLEVEEDHSYVANMVSVHNCFVLGVEDSMESIMDTLKYTAIIHKSGGGTGFNFSKIRPEGDFVSSTSGAASGPLSFMRMFDTMTEVVKQGGIRRGANMGILNSNHPDIEKFITAKEGNKALTNFNISVLLMPDFWECYEKNKPYPLVNPRNGEVVKTVDPKALFDKIVYQAWESAEPGVIFFDIVNDYNPFFEHLGPIVTTNPCGEVLLYPNEPCNLGSINVWAFAKEDGQGNVYYDWNGLKEVTKKCTKLLDNVIDVNKFPLKQIEEMSLNTRKIGLGVMGVGDLLYELRLPYNSDEGRKFMEKLMQFIAYHSHAESMELARKRGNLPYYDKSFYKGGRLPFRGFELKDEWEHDWKKLSDDVKKYGTRNGYTTVIAPTGSISMIAGCSSGMEPVYSLAFEKNVKVGSFYYVDPAFERALRREGLYSEELMQEICENGGSVQGLEDFPAKLQKAFVTAMDITPEDHIRALAAFQKWVDSSISKTNNFPADATVEHMRDSYILAYKLGCKDVTVFRDSSIKNQVLVAPKKKEIEKKAEAVEIKHELRVAGNGSAMAQKELDSGSLVMQSESKGKTRTCPECGGQAQIQEGCVTCKACGWALCK
ncbi:adenosylcobalamin-dependent ribonucleoside-diphosphate reductase [Candidatus Woesearchaeota archaeon]|nr:adenosylcobalamin-dependent ribonucleoside-diphosphate reductase [Candidatus Woesearchaeota archaeon]